MSIDDYKISPRSTTGLFTVKNSRKNKEYEVDIHTPTCTCEAFMYAKYDKKTCKHIKVCKSINTIKLDEVEQK